MTRKECLDAAAQCVLQDRASQYGGMEDNFGRIALLWSDYLGMKLDAVDVAMCMALLKVARIRANKGHADSFVDLAGYAACGAECAHREEERLQAVQDAGREYAARKAEAAFHPGDRVQVQLADGVPWKDAEYEGPACAVLYKGGRLMLKPEAVRPMPAPRAEGVEELVDPFHDAPQTPEAVCKHIVEANPATYGAPHNPTGEELAELAEDAHG